MQPFRTRRNSSSRHIVDPRNIDLSLREAWDEAGSRHDLQMYTGRTVPADPYTAWLERREGHRGSSAVPV
jgi:hypothetical protein